MQLKRKLAGPEPGPGSYNPHDPKWGSSSVDLLERKTTFDASNSTEVKPAAFGGSSPRFEDE